MSKVVKNGKGTIHAVIYDRGSDRRQEDNYSRQDAKREGIAIAERYGFSWEYLKEIGSGATLTGRPILMSILDRIEAGEIQAIIVQDLDRLARPEERAVYETTREICIENGIKIYTQSGNFDLENDNDDFMADIKMASAKKERKDIIRRSMRGMKEKAREGGFNGGPPPWGYKLEWTQEHGSKPVSELVIDEEQAPIVQKVFELYVLHGAGGTAKRLNKAGYRTPKNGKKRKHKGLIHAAYVYRVVQKPIYAGFVVWGQDKQSKYLRNYQPEWVHRPELQIVDIALWEKAQEVMKERSLSKKEPGSNGKYPFTGLLRCPSCGGSLSGTYRSDGRNIYYRCTSRTIYGKEACSKPKSYSHNNVTIAAIDVLTNLISQAFDIEEALQQAADEYGTTFTENRLKQQLEAELKEISVKKNNVVMSVATGLFTEEEAKQAIQELRDAEAEKQRELATISRKETIRKEYLDAIESFRYKDIKMVLTEMAENDHAIFRRVLFTIFKPNSIEARTWREKGYWYAEITGYELTDGFEELLSEYAAKDNQRYPADEAAGRRVVRIEIAVGIIPNQRQL